MEKFLFLSFTFCIFFLGGSPECLGLIGEGEVSGVKVFSRNGVEYSQGMQVTYEAYAVVSPFRPLVREDFRVTIKELWTGGAVFDYQVDGSIEERGIQSLSSLDTCISLDPWWDPEIKDGDGRCELWLSPGAYRALLSEGRAYFAIDTVARKDSSVRLEFLEETRYLCEIGGRPVRLPAIRIKTTRNDELVVLAHPERPLVLSIQSGYFSWFVRKIDYP